MALSQKFIALRQGQRPVDRSAKTNYCTVQLGVLKQELSDSQFLICPKEVRKTENQWQLGS